MWKSILPPLLISILITSADPASVKTSPKAVPPTVGNTNTPTLSILNLSTLNSSPTPSPKMTSASPTLLSLEKTSHGDLIISTKTSKASVRGNSVQFPRKCHLPQRTLYPTSKKQHYLHNANLLSSCNSTFLPKSSKLPSSQSTLSPKALPSFTKAPPTKLSLPEAAAFYRPWKLPPVPSLPDTTSPLFEHQPFFVTWNIPDRVCKKKNISLDTSPFHGITTPAKARKNNI